MFVIIIIIIIFIIIIIIISIISVIIAITILIINIYDYSYHYHCPGGPPRAAARPQSAERAPALIGLNKQSFEMGIETQVVEMKA